MPRMNWPVWLAGMAGMAVVYHSVLIRLVVHEWARDDFDYCYLIPVVMGWLVWERRDILQALPSRGSWAGLVAFVCAFALYLLGELGGEFLALYLSLWCALVGVCWIILGWTKLRMVLFPLLLLLTAFPPPNYLYSRLTLGLQLISSKLGVAFLHLLNIPAYREGNVIDLGVTKLEVVAACSGLRFLIPLFIVAMLLAYYQRGAWWKRLVLLISSIPMAILVNGLRIGVTGILVRMYGVSMASGATHDTLGWIMFVICTGMMLGLTRLLSDAGSEAGPVVSAAVGPGRSGLAPLLVGLALLGAAYGTVWYKGSHPVSVPARAPLASMPMQYPGWEGKRSSLGLELIEELDLSDYIQADYRNSAGQSVDFYVAWYNSQRKGESIHSPETCLRGGGWEFQRTGAAQVEISGYGSLRVNRTLVEQNGQKMIAYFWFPVRGHNLVNGVELKLHTFWGALTTGRTDGGLVRFITPVYDNEDIQNAEKRLQGFLGLILPDLDRILPDGKAS